MSNRCVPHGKDHDLYIDYEIPKKEEEKEEKKEAFSSDIFMRIDMDLTNQVKKLEDVMIVDPFQRKKSLMKVEKTI